MTSQTPRRELHVLIVGAGISGLILAQGLKKAEIQYTIFERDDGLNVRSNEWTMAIHWSLERLEAILPPEIYASMTRASCNPGIPIDAGGKYPIINGDTGDMLTAVPYDRGLRVPRSKMRALCAEGIDVQYGKTLSDVAFNESGSGVVASFSDGSVVSGSIIVGADGPRSRVREFAVGSVRKASNVPFPIWHMNLTVCYGDAEKAQYLRRRFPTSYLALSPRNFHAFQSISNMPDGQNHPETWVFHLAMAWLGQAQHELSYSERLAIIKEKAESLAEPARSAFTWIPDETLVHKADISYWITQPWENRAGRLTLIGDAAHPMPPYRGQGLNHCICDVSHLLEALKEVRNGDKPLNKAIAMYEDEMIPRGAAEVKCSVENGLMLHDWDKVQASPVFRTGFKPTEFLEPRVFTERSILTECSEL